MEKPEWKKEVEEIPPWLLPKAGGGGRKKPTEGKQTLPQIWNAFLQRSLRKIETYNRDITFQFLQVLAAEKGIEVAQFFAKCCGESCPITAGRLCSVHEQVQPAASEIVHGILQDFINSIYHLLITPPYTVLTRVLLPKAAEIFANLKTLAGDLQWAKLVQEYQKTVRRTVGELVQIQTSTSGAETKEKQVAGELLAAMEGFTQPFGAEFSIIMMVFALVRDNCALGDEETKDLRKLTRAQTQCIFDQITKVVLRSIQLQGSWIQTIVETLFGSGGSSKKTDPDAALKEILRRGLDKTLHLRQADLDSANARLNSLPEWAAEWDQGLKAKAIILLSASGAAPPLPRAVLRARDRCWFVSQLKPKEVGEEVAQNVEAMTERSILSESAAMIFTPNAAELMQLFGLDRSSFLLLLVTAKQLTLMDSSHVTVWSFNWLYPLLKELIDPDSDLNRAPLTEWPYLIVQKFVSSQGTFAGKLFQTANEIFTRLYGDKWTRIVGKKLKYPKMEPGEVATLLDYVMHGLHLPAGVRIDPRPLAVASVGQVHLVLDARVVNWYKLLLVDFRQESEALEALHAQRIDLDTDVFRSRYFSAIHTISFFVIARPADDEKNNFDAWLNAKWAVEHLWVPIPPMVREWFRFVKEQVEGLVNGMAQEAEELVKIETTLRNLMQTPRAGLLERAKIEARIQTDMKELKQAVNARNQIRKTKLSETAQLLDDLKTEFVMSQRLVIKFVKPRQRLILCMEREILDRAFGALTLHRDYLVATLQKGACAPDSDQDCGMCTQPPPPAARRCAGYCVSRSDRCRRMAKPTSAYCAQHEPKAASWFPDEPARPFIDVGNVLTQLKAYQSLLSCKIGEIQSEFNLMQEYNNTVEAKVLYEVTQGAIRIRVPKVSFPEDLSEEYATGAISRPEIETRWAANPLPAIVQQLMPGAELIKLKSGYTFKEGEEKAVVQAFSVFARKFVEVLLLQGKGHGDPHPGNLLWFFDAETGTGQLSVIDFGDWISFEPVQEDIFRRLLTAWLVFVAEHVRLSIGKERVKLRALIENPLLPQVRIIDSVLKGNFSSAACQALFGSSFCELPSKAKALPGVVLQRVGETATSYADMLFNVITLGRTPSVKEKQNVRSLFEQNSDDLDFFVALGSAIYDASDKHKATTSTTEKFARLAGFALEARKAFEADISKTDSLNSNFFLLDPLRIRRVLQWVTFDENLCHDLANRITQVGQALTKLVNSALAIVGALTGGDKDDKIPILVAAKRLSALVNIAQQAYRDFSVTLTKLGEKFVEKVDNRTSPSFQEYMRASQAEPILLQFSGSGENLALKVPPQLRALKQVAPIATVPRQGEEEIISYHLSTDIALPLLRRLLKTTS